jgi:O-acetyl-ADP-ribose deacetylase
MSTDNKLSELLHICQGDITQIDVDAIVNAANTSLLGGGGVDGAIHRAAGPKLMEECYALHGCKTGDAKLTKGYNLKARYVIHTPGAFFKDGSSGEAALLRKSYLSCMDIAKDLSLKSIAFPAISTGMYRYPKDEAATIALTSVIEHMTDKKYFPQVYFILFDKENYSIYLNIIQNIFKKIKEIS